MTQYIQLDEFDRPQERPFVKISTKSTRNCKPKFTLKKEGEMREGVENQKQSQSQNQSQIQNQKQSQKKKQKQKRKKFAFAHLRAVPHRAL